MRGNIELVQTRLLVNRKLDGGPSQHTGRPISSASHHNQSLGSQHGTDPIKAKEEKLRSRLCHMRNWEYTNLGKQLERGEVRRHGQALQFTVLSYNLLAQHLLETHTYLYKRADPEALVWEKRASRILREVRDSTADILCLQEVQADQFETFYLAEMKKLGFTGIFKKRTGDKSDGKLLSKFKPQLCLKAINYRLRNFLAANKVSFKSKHFCGILQA